MSRLKTALSFGALVVSLLFVPSGAAYAAQFCVDTESELQLALSVSQINGQSNDIRIQQGSYSMPGGASPGVLELIYPHNLTISGGWNSDCTNRSLDPAATTINGEGNGGSSWWFHSYASITLDGLRFVNSHSFRMGGGPECNASGVKFTFRRTIFDGNQGRSLFATPCHSVRLENNLIVNSQDTGIEIECRESMTYQLINNTIRDSLGTGLAVNQQGVPVGPCITHGLGLNRLSNNVIDKVLLDEATPVALNNIFDQLNTSDGGGLFPGSGNNLIQNPLLDANYRPIEPNSPAINSGTDSVPGGLPATDITGATRVIGGTVDRGAFESSVVPPGPFVLTVTSSASSGTGTLRDILNQANANPGLNLVQFDIPGGCPRFITLAEPLPDITESVIINGYSQSGASFNNFEHGNNGVLCIGLIASQLVDVPFALRVPPNSSAKLTVRGIGFGGYDDGGGLLGEAAIFLQGGSGHQIQGNQFGGAFHGTTLAVSSENIRLMNSASNALIGGSSPANRNTLSGSSLAAIQVIGTASHDHQIINNYIGTNPAGTEAVGNLDGIRLIHSEDNQILDNLISGQTLDGIVLTGEGSTSNLIAGNRIGGRREGIFLCGVPPLPPCPPVPTNRKGILIDSDASNNSIGVAGPEGRPNLIRYSTQHAIRILSGQRNRILSNSLSLNGSVASEIEIDLGSFGLDTNDNDCAASADLLANRGQNRPVLAAASIDGDEIAIEGVLASCSNTGGFTSVYRIQLFASSSCDPGGTGPAQDFLGDVNVIISAPDNTQATVAIDASLAIPEGLNVAGRQITATATDLFGNTSELSNCVPAVVDGLFADRFEQ